MWGLAVGIGIGVAQVFALKALVKMIMGKRKALGMLLLLLKIAVVVALLWLVGSISVTHLIWAAGGTLAGLIIGILILQMLQKRAGKDGDDRNDG